MCNKYLYNAYTKSSHLSPKNLPFSVMMSVCCLLITACGGSDEKVTVESVSNSTKQPAQNNEAQKAQIEAQKAQIEAQKAQIEAQKAQIDKHTKQPETPKVKQSQPKKDSSPGLSMKTEKSLAIIKDFSDKNNKVYVTVDFIQYIEASDTEVGGIKNVNPKLRTYIVSQSEYKDCTANNTESVDSLRTEWEALKRDEPLYHISAVKGKVVELYLSCAG